MTLFIKFYSLQCVNNSFLFMHHYYCWWCLVLHHNLFLFKSQNEQLKLY